jgi:BCD family chlorophyll transporter-like MFS transporter
LVQAAIGAVIVLMTSTLNRVMVVELGLAAIIPGALVGLHFGVQLSRPHFGFGSDRGTSRIPWIIGGMGLTALSGIGAAVATVWMASNVTAGLLFAVFSFFMLGVGVSAGSTPYLAYMAERVDEPRMAGAAAMTWILMIAGIIVTASVAGSLLDPYSPARLVQVTAGISLAAFVLTLVALVGRSSEQPIHMRSQGEEQGSFSLVWRAMWDDPQSRSFAMFIFVSMLAYSAQDIILEPFAGAVFGMTPGESTRIAGLQHGGVLIGMILGAFGAARFGRLVTWAAVGCLASAMALVALVLMPATGSIAGLKAAVFSLGFANGIFAVAAIGSMMGLTIRGKAGGAGMRMGFWGAAQAIAYGLGGMIGAAGSDIAREALGSPAAGYGVVFSLEAALFVVAALLVLTRVRDQQSSGLEALRRAGRAMAEAA